MQIKMRQVDVYAKCRERWQVPVPLPVAGGQTGGRPALALRQHSARPAVGWHVATLGEKLLQG